MIFDRRERQVRSTLRKLSRQRAVMVVHGMWVIEKAVPDTDENQVALKTCHMRGWIEPLENAIPKRKLTFDGNSPKISDATMQPMYRMTDSGWAVINRTHMLQLMGIFLAAVAAIIGLN